ncbi:MAG: hypothetical protein WCI73_08085, partial [Phycisphaerae bacterium]
MSDRIVRISFLPDLSMPKYAARYGPSAAGRASNVVSDIGRLLDHRTEDWLLLRYLYLPHASSPQER